MGALVRLFWTHPNNLICPDHLLKDPGVQPWGAGLECSVAGGALLVHSRGLGYTEILSGSSGSMNSKVVSEQSNGYRKVSGRNRS